MLEQKYAAQYSGWWWVVGDGRQVGIGDGFVCGWSSEALRWVADGGGRVVRDMGRWGDC